MSDARMLNYLRECLSLDPRSEAAAILAVRRGYLAPQEPLEAQLADDGEPTDPRTQALEHLQSLRQRFWSAPVGELQRRLEALAKVPFADVATAAARLREVVAQRETLRQLQHDPRIHPAFMKALAEIVIAAPTKANRLREQQLRWMRPEQNPGFQSALTAMRNTAQLLQHSYPAVFALEEGWLTEILTYDPIEETLNVSAYNLLGLGMVVIAVVALVGTVQIVVWIFS